MYLTHLSLTNFRNYARLDVEAPIGNVLLVGNNAQGKTSLLEAIYYLAAFVSFHADSDRELINFIAGRELLAVARITAHFQSGREAHKLEARIIQEPNGGNGGSRLRKEVLLDGVKRKMGDVIGAFTAVLFLPQMLDVVEGAPEGRRRYLNLTLSQAAGGYANALGEYSRSLSQRNALLKQLFERGGDPEQLEYWDAQLTTSGAVLIRERIHCLQELEKLAAEVHRELTGGDEILRLLYQPAYDPLPRPANQYALRLDAQPDRSGITLEEIQRGFEAQLRQLRREEIERGVTTIGPHRDELRFLSNGIDLGIYGSRGQVRTLMLALKLAEAAWIKERTGQWPVLLLDEVLAELDEQRRADLLNRLVACEQVWMTTTDLNLFNPDFVAESHLWRVEAGCITNLEGAGA